MKTAIRVSALTLVIAAAVAGNSVPKNSTVAAIHQSSVPGPTPYCNPFTDKCPNMRAQ
jgi:hypothetical protein